MAVSTGWTMIPSIYKISITYLKKSNSDEIEIVEVVQKYHKYMFDTLSNSNKPEDADFNKTRKMYLKFYQLLQAGDKIFTMKYLIAIFHLWKNLLSSVKR